MATFNTAFGSLPGYNELLGTTNTTGGGQQQTYQPRPAQQQQTTQQQPQTAQTFAQMQQRGLARPPAPTAPAARPFQQFGGSQLAGQMRQQLQQQLQQFGQAPSRFDTQAFQQIRGAQQANLQSEFQEQQRQLNEDLARRGLSASTIGAAGLGRLAGAQSRALADIDAQLLQRAAETQAQDRAQLLAEGRGLAELAASQDLAQFEANRVAQAAEFEQGLRGAEFGQRQFEQAGEETLQAAQAAQAYEQFSREMALRESELLGEVGGAQTLAARQQAQQQRQFEMEQALRQVLGLGGLEVQRAEITGRLGEGAAAQQTLGSQQQQFQQQQLLFQQAQQMSEQSGIQHTVDANGRIVQLRDAQGNLVRTSAATQAEENRKLQERELGVRRQLGLTEATGQVVTGFDEEGNPIYGADTLQASLQRSQAAFQNAARLSEQSGFQYTVTPEGRVEQLMVNGQPVRTSAFTQADEARRQQDTLTRLDLQLRRQLGLTEATGQMYNIDPITGVATLATGGTGAQTVEARRVAMQERQMAIQSAMQLSEQSGIQHEVKSDGTVAPMRDTNGQPVRTSAVTQASLDRALREQLGMMEATGQTYTRDAAGTVSLATGAAARQTIQAQQLAFQRAAQLSEQSGIQHEVKADGTVAPMRDAAGQPVRTSAESRFNLDLQFRRQMGLMEQTGQMFNIDPTTGRATLATGTDALSTLGRLQQNLQMAQAMSQITGQQYTVDASGQLVAAPSGGRAATEAARQFDLEQLLRRQLGLTEASGFIYDLDRGQLTRSTTQTVQSQIARNQTIMALANALGNLTPDQVARLLGQQTQNPQNVDQNNPDTWAAGTLDGEVRRTADGREFRYSTSQRKWLPVGSTSNPPPSNPPPNNPPPNNPPPNNPPQASPVPDGLSPNIPQNDDRYIGMSARANDGKMYRWNGTQWVLDPNQTSSI